jgi:hypothetical protein
MVIPFQSVSSFSKSVIPPMALYRKKGNPVGSLSQLVEKPTPKISALFGRLAFLDGFDRAVVRAGTAANANVSIDYILVFAFGDGLNGAVVRARATLYACIVNHICHNVVPPLFLCIASKDARIFYHVFCKMQMVILKNRKNICRFVCFTGRLGRIYRERGRRP